MDGMGITQRENGDNAQTAVFSETISSRESHSKESVQTDSLDLAMRSLVQTSIDQLYKNIYDIQSSNESPTGSSARESRIDSELLNLVGGYSTGMNKHDDAGDDGDDGDSQYPPHQEESATPQKPRNTERKKKTKTKTKTIKLNRNRLIAAATENLTNLFESIHRATERAENGDEKLELVMCLHILAAGYYKRGEYSSAITILKHSIGIPVDHSVSKFSAHMLLGEIYQTLGEMENSIESYEKGMEIQRRELGERDARFGTTCRHVAAAQFQALRIEEAEKLCVAALEIHRGNSDEEEEEAEDRMLMGLICDSAENRIEHYVLAGIAMAANGNEGELANIDCSIGDAHMELSRFDEAGRAYHRALSRLKSRTKGNRTILASIYTRMAGLCHRTGKLREARDYCENAVGMCRNRVGGIAVEEIAAVLLDLSSVLQSMDDLDRALELLEIARKIYRDRGGGGESSLIACVEARIGVVHYMRGGYSDSCNSLKSAIDKLRKMEETPVPIPKKKKKPALLGIVLNQMGMACLQRNAINEALESFEEAKDVLETAYGISHDQTLAVYSNLSATYDVIGRIGDAIALLGHVVRVGEEKHGTANEEVVHQRRRLLELLEEESRRVPTRKPKSLNALLRIDEIHVL